LKTPFGWRADSCVHFREKQRGRCRSKWPRLGWLGGASGTGRLAHSAFSVGTEPNDVVIQLVHDGHDEPYPRLFLAAGPTGFGHLGRSCQNRCESLTDVGLRHHLVPASRWARPWHVSVCSRDRLGTAAVATQQARGNYVVQQRAQHKGDSTGTRNSARHPLGCRPIVIRRGVARRTFLHKRRSDVLTATLFVSFVCWPDCRGDGHGN